MKMTHLLATLCLASATCFAAEDQVLLELQEITVDHTAAQRAYAVFKSNEETSRTVRIPLQFSPDKVGRNERNIIMLIRFLPADSKVGFMVPKNTPDKVSEWELAYLKIKRAEPTVRGDGKPAPQP